MLQKKKTTDYQHIFRLVVIATILFALGASAAISAEKYSTKDLKAMMARVWQNCETNLDNLHNYVFNETEVWENNLRGLGYRRDIAFPEQLRSFRREYVWVVRNNYLVRSPIRIGGVEVSPEEQKAGEEEWIKEQQNQSSWKSILDCFTDFLHYCSDKFGVWSYPAKGKVEYVYPVFFSTPMWNDVRPEFDPEQYHYSGEVQFQGRKLAAIEYAIKLISQPLKNFPGVVDASVRGGMGNSSYSQSSSLTLTFELARLKMLIDPDECQLVRYAFSTKTCGQKREFSMVMDKANGDVWLPKVFFVTADTTGALDQWRGSARYSREFYSYSRADVKAKFWSEDVKARIWFDMDDIKPKQ